jgi:hypothetical protein
MSGLGARGGGRRVAAEVAASAASGRLPRGVEFVVKGGRRLEKRGVMGEGGVT